MKDIRMRVAEIPQPFKDVADLLQSEGGSAKYERMIREAKAGVSWQIANLGDVEGVSEHDLTTLDGTVAACEDMVDTLLRQPPIARSAYVRELAQKLEVPEREIRQTLNQVIAERGEHYDRHPEDRPPPIRVDIP